MQTQPTRRDENPVERPLTDKQPPARLLHRLSPGEGGLILKIDAEPAIVRRLMELGLVPGNRVDMIRRAPLGDPMEVTIQGVHLSLRRSEASRIHVAPA